MTDGPWYGARGVIVSAAFLAVLLVVGGIAVVAGGRSTASVTTSTRPAPGRPVETGGSLCDMPIGNTDTPVGPPAATWKLLGRIVVPASPSVGPGIETGHRRVCWAHSPTGALFAAASFLATGDVYGDDVAAMREVLATTHARDVLLKQNSEPHQPFLRAQIAGFRVEPVSANDAIVELALQTNQQGAIVAMSLPMRWEQRAEGGDWRFVITDPQQPYTGAVIDDLSGFVRWGQA